MLLLLACAPSIPDCGPNQHVTAAGECADDPDIPGAEDLPACTPLPEGDRIDVYAGCADGACHDTTYETMNAVLDEEGACHTTEGLAFCDWSVGISTFFADENGDAVPDEDALGSGIFLDPPYDGATANGNGLGVSLGCWIDVYGYTDEVEYNEEGWISQIWWPELGLFLHENDGDGITDEISLFSL